jgi:hypothetical protein
MDSLRAQIEPTTLDKREILLVYQWFAYFQKGSIWAHCTDIKGLKEF